jgi:hypothetical protein
MFVSCFFVAIVLSLLQKSFMQVVKKKSHYPLSNALIELAGIVLYHFIFNALHIDPPNPPY